VVPGSWQLVGDANGLVLRGDLDGHAVARLGGPSFDLDLLNVLAFALAFVAVFSLMTL
jgi:hypothetical protein